MRLADFVARLERSQRQADGSFMALCPVPSHGDNGDSNRSLSVSEGTDGRLLVYCFGGCSIDAVLTAMSLTRRDLFTAPAAPAPTRRRAREVEALYDYRSESGQLLYQAVRYRPKAFSQRRPDGQGGWANNLDGVRRVPFRLPELLASPADAAICWCEGERDALALIAHHLIATTFAGGTSTPLPRHEPAAFTGRDVVIFADSDTPGRAFAQRRAAWVHPHARSVKVCEVPHGKDPAGFLESGGTLEQLLATIAAAPRWEPPHRAPDARERPRVDTTVMNRASVAAAIAALQQVEADAPTLFANAGATVRVNGARMERLDTLTARAVLDQLVSCIRVKRDGDAFEVLPPVDLVHMILNAPASPFPPLRRVVTVPIFGSDGSLRLTPGYDAATGVYLVPAFPPLPVLDAPGRSDALAAVAVLDGLIGDFPFASPADRAAALGLAILPFVVDMIAGPVPLHLIMASTPGTGKTLLIGALWVAAFGLHDAAFTGLPETEDELRKALTTLLMEGRPGIVLDNLGRFLKSATLARYITAYPSYLDRVLGRNEGVTLPGGVPIVITGNNPGATDELARRTIAIELTTDLERPEDRRGFVHADLLGWANAHRPELVHAVHVIVRYWIVSGRPPVSDRIPALGSFANFRAVIGAILEAVGVEGWLDNRARLRADVDSSSAAWADFVASWAAVFPTSYGTPRSASDLLDLALEAGVRPNGESREARAASFATLLGIHRRRVFHRYRIEQGQGRERRKWRLVEVVAGDTHDTRDTDFQPFAGENVLSCNGDVAGGEGLRNGGTGDTGVTELGDAFDVVADNVDTLFDPERL